MGDIAKGVLGGAWTLLVGWILPTALNLAVFSLTVAPAFEDVQVLDPLWPGSKAGAMLLLLTASLLLGLVANACQNSLYRILEGYLLWPGWAYELGCRRSREAKHRLADRVLLMRIERRQGDPATLRGQADLADRRRIEGDPSLVAAVRGDRRRTAAQRGLVHEKLARFPVSDDQIAPTRLGNAIRRFEEYGEDRYRLDTQTLWNELTGCVPDQLRKQTEVARTSVDFFVALLSGHVFVAALAVAALVATETHTKLLVATALVLAALTPVWYRSAITSTDEWAAAVRALVNAGRKPLAGALGLRLPKEIAEERAMWQMVSRLSRVPYIDRASALDRFRVEVVPADGQAGN